MTNIVFVNANTDIYLARCQNRFAYDQNLKNLLHIKSLILLGYEIIHRKIARAFEDE